MSPVGRFILSHCQNNLSIDLNAYYIPNTAEWYKARTVCLFLGLTIVGGS